MLATCTSAHAAGSTPSCPAANGDAYSTAVLADDPIAYYRLDESSGLTMCDSSTSDNDGTYSSSGVTYGTSGALADGDGAVAYDSDTAPLGESNSDPSGLTGNHAYTLEAWFQNDETSTPYTNSWLVGIGGTGGNGDAAVLSLDPNHNSQLGWGPTSALTIDQYGADWAWDPSTAGINLWDGNWHYIAVTYTPSTTATASSYVAYVDGQSLGNPEARPYGNDVTDIAASPIIVGNAQGGSNYWSNFDGGIDEVAVYGTALSAARIAAHYAAASEQTLTVSTEGGGSVSSDPSGIDCGNGATECSGFYENDAPVTLTATPAAGATFTGWSGGGCSGTSTCTVTMSSAQSVTAAFTTPAPVNTSAPVISGDTVVGDQLSSTTGTWSNSPTSFTYQWEDCTTTAATSCTDVAAEGTSSTYTLTSDDVGKYVTVIVSAHNAATTAGTATGGPVKGPVTKPTTPPPPAGKPVNTAPPKITGAATSGRTLSCSQGTWSPAATSFAYSWSADGTPIIGAGTSTYTVQQIDEGLTIACTVTASNTGGSSAPATSAGVKVPVPVVKDCPKATGALGGTTLGLIHLGMTRKQVRHTYKKSSDRGKAYMDFFCLTPRGVRVGYASPKLLKTLPRSKRAALSGRVIWASTSNGYYSAKGIRPGATLAAARQALPGGNYFRVGANYWYLAADGAGTAVLKLRGGVVQEIGIGVKALTTGLKAQKVFMTSFE